MSQMVERAATALFETAGGDLSQSECNVLARAAIEAMREPTEGMFIAGVACLAEFADYPDGDMSFPILWGHVIDEALK